jgi:coenzyme F420-dependent glucose-6-phosphate dehydrogenase
MVTLGYKLCSEETAPSDLVRFARMAEDSGFSFGLISDHFHPWTDAQGQSPFVWSVVGAIAHATSRLVVGTGVTCPTMRLHPVIVAQAAATSAAMMPGRFLLGVPDESPPLLVAAAGPRSAELAGRLGDGLVATEPNQELVERFDAAGGRGKPRYAELTVCWAKDEASARRIAHERWPIAALTGSLTTELALPIHFQGAARMLDEDAVAETVVCGPDPQRHVDAIARYARAGFDHVGVHQVGPDQEGFMRFYAREVMPRLAGTRAAA